MESEELDEYLDMALNLTDQCMSLKVPWVAMGGHRCFLLGIGDALGATRHGNGSAVEGKGKFGTAKGIRDNLHVVHAHKEGH